MFLYSAVQPVSEVYTRSWGGDNVDCVGDKGVSGLVGTSKSKCVRECVCGVLKYLVYT